MRRKTDGPGFARLAAVLAGALGMYPGVMMWFFSPVLPLLLALGTVFGVLAAACAYLISYSEARRRFLRPDQDPRRIGLATATVTFVFFIVMAIVLSFVLPLVMKPIGP